MRRVGVMIVVGLAILVLFYGIYRSDFSESGNEPSDPAPGQAVAAAEAGSEASSETVRLLEQARAYMAKAGYADARIVYIKALKASGGDPDIALEMVECCLKLNRFDLADNTLKSAAIQHPQHEGLLLKRAGLEFSSGNKGAAIGLLEQALKGGLESTDVSLLLAEFYLDTHRRDEAAKQVQALGGVPLNARQRVAWAWLQQALGRPAEAQKKLEQSLAEYPEHPAILEALLRTHREAGDLDQAADLLVRAGRAGLPAGRLALEQAEIEVGRGLLDQAIHTLEEAHAEADVSGERQARLAELLIQAGRRDEARQLLLELIASPYRSATFRGYLVSARLFQGLGLHTLALEHAEDALRYEPENLSALYLRAAALLSKGETEEAQATVDALRALDPGYPALAELEARIRALPASP